MAILGLGVDLVHLPRVAALVSRRGADRFARRVLSSSELLDWRPKDKNSLQYLAVRFSVKEAAYKALYSTCRPTWKELTYTGFGNRFPGSKPTLLYTPDVISDREKVGQLHVSISHDGDYIFSTVIVESP